jgi:hypothetical protein
MSLVNLNDVKLAWVRKFGATRATAMMSGAVVAAYDSKRGFARDDDPDPNGSNPMPDDDDASGIGQIQVFLRNRLSTQDYQRFCQMMAALNGGTIHPSTYDLDKEQGQDEPPDFPGKPRPGGKMAGDARPRSYHDEFPANASVDVYGGR